ncbi:uncharacterized protein LOC119648092 isoform X4 [Hermetia illucens]|uniref:uncharacterized protein LOC119648092 isoform X4 n=1 Tax=Hermetia illucens TaxID=343691 RepID=UPI0018CC57EA|nr:uncharacterized protein LOC119648092 isoform X4 [Hermetia illucens]
MSECHGDYQKLPPGWDCKVDKTTGKCYYINYFTKAMQLEDPRKRYKQLQNDKCSSESIAMQPLHGSPYHVYPASNYPAVKAFQGPNPSLHNVSASPLLSTKSQVQMEMSSILRPSSPQTPRINNLPRRQTIQETSFSNNIDTDAVVAKINNMFPTASENHIRLLLKKYLKNVFPKADETLLLDILANSDNNVQKASEKLVSMGYTKRDMLAAPKLSSRMEEAKRTAESSDEKIIPLHPKVLTAEEKESIKQTLQTQYKSIAERIILMALESVNYSEDRASQILQIVLQEDESKEKKKKPKEGETSKLEGVVKEEPETISESINESQVTEDTQATAVTKCTPSKESSSSLLSPRATHEGQLETTVDSGTVATSPLASSAVQSCEVKIVEYCYDSVPIPVFDTPCFIATTYHEPGGQAQSPHSSTSSPPSSSSSPLSSSSSIGHSVNLKKIRSKAKSDFTKYAINPIFESSLLILFPFFSLISR